MSKFVIRVNVIITAENVAHFASILHKKTILCFEFQTLLISSS